MSSLLQHCRHRSRNRFKQFHSLRSFELDANSAQCHSWSYLGSVLEPHPAKVGRAKFISFQILSSRLSLAAVEISDYTVAVTGTAGNRWERVASSFNSSCLTKWSKLGVELLKLEYHAACYAICYSILQLLWQIREGSSVSEWRWQDHFIGS